MPELARREQEALREKTRLQTRGRSGTDLEKLQDQEVVEQLQPLAWARARWEERQQWDRDREEEDSTDPLLTAIR